MSEVAVLRKQLDAGLADLALEFDLETRQRLLDYLSLMQKWNRSYNLTAIRDPQQMLSHHLLDSLAVLPLLRRLESGGVGQEVENSALARRRHDSWRLGDVGSGAGLPGLVLAMACPEWQIVSIEAVDKKAAFQRQACIELGLRNVTVLAERVETVAAASVDAVISRAFASLDDFARVAGHLLAPGGRLLAMKGVLPEAEIAALAAEWRLVATYPVSVPSLEAQRHLIVLEKA